MSGLRPNSFFLDRVISARRPDDVLINFSGNALRTCDLAEKSCFKSRKIFAGLNVMVAVHETYDSALALFELDGVANRIVVCPPMLPQDHLDAIAASADVDFIISDTRSDRPLTLADVSLINGLQFKRDQDEAGTIEPTATQWVLLTSGTTGIPKMVAHTFESLTVNIRKPDSNGLPITWASFNDMRRFSGLQMFLHALLTDSTLVLKPVDLPVGDFLPFLTKAGATHVSGTPTHWRKVLMFEDRGRLPLQQVTLVGEIADQPILDSLTAAFPTARLTHIYGSTEAGTGFSVHDGKAGFPSAFVGKNLKGLELQVDAGGMLRMRSNRAAIEYIGDTPAKLRNSDGYIETGDQVELQGNRYRFLGRRNGAVNIGGSRVHPEEVEALLNAHPLVSMSAVSAKKSPFTGAILVADVVLKHGSQTSSGNPDAVAKAILADLRTKLDAYKVPATIRFVDDLKLSSAGKLERKSA